MARTRLASSATRTGRSTRGGSTGKRTAGCSTVHDPITSRTSSKGTSRWRPDKGKRRKDSRVEHCAAILLTTSVTVCQRSSLHGSETTAWRVDRTGAAPTCRRPPSATSRASAREWKASSTTRRPNLSQAAQRYLESVGAGVESLFYHALAVLHDPAYREANAGALRMEWPRIPLPGWPDGDAPNASCELAASAERGRQLAALLDSAIPVHGVTEGELRPELAVIAVPSTADGHNRGFAKTWVLGLLVSVGCIMSRGVRGRRSCVGW